MTRQHEEHKRPILTAVLTTGVARVTHGLRESARLIDEILTLDHVDSETILYIGDVEYHSKKSGGPYPNHQFRISVRPSAGFAALNYMDHDDRKRPVVNSYNPNRPLPDVDLIFNGTTGAVFPRTAAIPVANARDALYEWLKTRKRPTCIAWRTYDDYTKTQPNPPKMTETPSRRRGGLADARKAVGHTQESLAAELHVTRETIGHWEAGRYTPLPYIRPKLGRLLGLSQQQLDDLIREPNRNAGPIEY